MLKLISMLALIMSACGSAGSAPVAHIDLHPSILCELQPDQAITLSGKRSTAAHGQDSVLSFSWTISPRPIEIVRGGLSQTEVAVRLNARQPARIHLDVRNDAGRTGTREVLLPLTRATLQSCDVGCGAQEICVSVAGVSGCANKTACTGDDECGCLRCRADDAGVQRCLP